ncbi:hypothetical protein F3259_14445, partial [Listeria monocytogenes]|nr:hypothetical protein [Listeria monocytogenes]ECX5846739.1 hypothetical protein [Listeria monocytogenes]
MEPASRPYRRFSIYNTCSFVSSILVILVIMFFKLSARESKSLSNLSFANSNILFCNLETLKSTTSLLELPPDAITK